MSLPDRPFIFVSYVREDSDFVYPEIERLEKQGYKIWYDKGELIPSFIWDKLISEAIEACSCFIVFITQDSVNSENVRKEIRQALDANKPFISIYWEEVQEEEYPPEFQEFVEPIQSRQALERYVLLKHEYEESLSRALAPYRRPGFEPPAPPQPDPRLYVLPQIVFFILAPLAVIFLLLAAILAFAPFFASALPGDPLNNRLGGVAAGILFAAIACGLGGAAFAVRWIFLRRKHG